MTNINEILPAELTNEAKGLFGPKHESGYTFLGIEFHHTL